MALSKRQTKRFGWRADLPDHRDRIYNLEQAIRREPDLPAQFSLRGEMPEVYNQGELGSCTANSIAAVLEYQEMREGMKADTPSRLFIYYGEREIEGTIPEDSGAQIRDGIKVVAGEGAPPETVWPYDIAKFAERPSEEAFAKAKLERAVAYQRILTGGHGAPIRTALYAHHPVSFGFTVPASFEDGSWNPAKEPLPLPGPKEKNIGGHAVAIVGWDFSKTRFAVNAFEIRNSWGPNWGDAGYFWMDAEWVDPSRSLSSDFWVISLVQ
jgi:C1A family cysteine protease